MVNREAYKNAVKIYPDNCDPNQEIVQALRMGYQVGVTEEKKKNIEKLRTILKDFNGKRHNGFDIVYTNYFIDKVCEKMEEPEKTEYVDDGTYDLDELRERLNLSYTQEDKNKMAVMFICQKGMGNVSSYYCENVCRKCGEIESTL